MSEKPVPSKSEEERRREAEKLRAEAERIPAIASEIYRHQMVETWLQLFWKGFAGECWRNALRGMEDEIRKFCWDPVPDLKIVNWPKGWIIAHRRLRMHLTVPFSGVAHITDDELKRKWRWFPEINAHNVLLLGPSFVLPLFEGCIREKISFFIAEADRCLGDIETSIRNVISASLDELELKVKTLEWGLRRDSID